MITNLFPTTLLGQLDKLVRLFVWNRKSLRDSIVDALQAADARHESMTQAHQHTLARLDTLIQSHAQMTEEQARTTAELESTKQSLINAQHCLEQYQVKQRHDQEQAKLRFDALSDRHDQLMQERDQLEATGKAYEKTLELTRIELRAILEANESLNQNLAQQQRAYAELTENFHALQQRHGDTWTRFELISRLLATRPQDSAGLARFRELLASDYMSFAESESSLAAEAKALTLLQSIEQELGVLVSFPDVRERTIVGIVGGFSSGKSEFINSFIHDQQVRLAVGLTPVTAIPSYVLSTDNRMIRGYSANGGHIDLDVEFYKNISHAFINSFSFDLKSLMPFMCVGVQMRHECFSNICFIDTPGYNAPSTAATHSQGDRLTAVKFAQQADSIIWLIALGTDGAVPDSDLEFIRQIGVEGSSVYVVLAKADLKAVEEIQDILEEVQNRLNDEGILIVGISAYSSIQREEVAYRDVSLLEYFGRLNRKGDTRKHLEKRLCEVFAMYEDAIQTDISAQKALKEALNGLCLDCLQFGGQDVYERMLVPINKLTQSVDTSPLEDWLQESRRLHRAFREAVQQTTTALEA